MSETSSKSMLGQHIEPRRKVSIVVLFLALLLVLVTTTAARPRPFVAIMSGGQEVPGPGDPDGFGIALIQLNERKGEVCFAIAVANITLPASAAHIHPGARGVAGPPIVPLAPPDERGIAKGCVLADPALVEAIRNNPSDYYVNVHNADFPGGAVRGQLK